MLSRESEGRWRPFTYEEIAARDKASLDIFWLRDESLEDSATLPEPHVLAEEIAEDLRAALDEIEDVLADLPETLNRPPLISPIDRPEGRFIPVPDEIPLSHRLRSHYWHPLSTIKHCCSG